MGTVRRLSLTRPVLDTNVLVSSLLFRTGGVSGGRTAYVCPPAVNQVLGKEHRRAKDKPLTRQSGILQDRRILDDHSLLSNLRHQQPGHTG